VIRTLAALAAVVLAVWACTVNTKSDTLACKTTADCSTGRTCQAGYCVTDGPVDAKQLDAAVCPPECASCDFATGTCNITGSAAPITCPATWRCVITCTDTQPCGDITCGTTACQVSCTGSGACASVSCASSCKCDVSCDPLGSACGAITCPTHANRDCTVGLVPGAPCDSSVAPQCRSCQ